MMSNGIKKFYRKCKAFFEAYGDEATRKTFGGELNYESGKLFFILFITMVVWLPYIPNDVKLHQYPVLAVSLRLGLSSLSIILIALRFSKRFRLRPGILLMTLLIYLYISTALVTATAGEYAASYIGGYAFVIMIPVFAPFPLKFKILAAILTLAVFFGVGTLTGLDFSSYHIKYAVNDLLTSMLVSLLLSYTQNILRYNAWEQRQKLSEMIDQNEKNLATIFNLASKAEAASKSKSEFLAKMSHEIRTPMNAILGISEIQMQRGALDPELEDALDKIHNSGQILLSIINDILDLSKIETGRLELNTAIYDIPSLINDTVSLNIVRIESKPIEFKLDIDETLPARLLGDELRLKQILNNLLSNAFKYTQRGSVTLSVDSVVEDDKVTLCFKVADTGQGMKPEDLERLFTEYSRFNYDANRATEGTGLGLSITKKLVEMMDGEIYVESEYEKGSIFTVKVVQKPVDDILIGSGLAEKLRGFSYIRSRQSANLRIFKEWMPYGSVLLVDDMETNLYVAKGLISPYGLKIETAISGLEAIDKIKNGAAYDIIFMDHMMPEIDGIETTKRLRATGYDAPIVALTANAITGNDIIFKENGFDDFISKPIDIRQLNEILNKFVRRKNIIASDVKEPRKLPEAAADVTKPDFNIEGIDSATGIRNIGGKLENYSKLLELFREDTGARLAELAASLEDGDIKLFVTHVHAMKSAAANIGALRLSELAKALEAAGNSDDTTYIEENLDAFLSELNKITQNIAMFFLKKKEPCADEPKNADAIRQKLEALRAALANIDIAAINAITAELGKIQGVSIMDEITRGVLLSDYDRVIQEIDEYLSGR